MRDKEPEKKIYREMLLQEVSPPNHVIVQFSGSAVALLDRVSPFIGAEGCCEVGALNFQRSSSLFLFTLEV